MPYHLNPKYKEKVHQELDKMLEACIIEPVEESDWVSLTVVQEKMWIYGSLMMHVCS